MTVSDFIALIWFDNDLIVEIITGDKQYMLDPKSIATFREVNKCVGGYCIFKVAVKHNTMIIYTV